MRHDPEDIKGARFIFDKAGWGDETVEKIIGSARVPDERELREQFSESAAHFVEWRRGIKNRISLDSSLIKAVAYDRAQKIKYRISRRWKLWISQSAPINVSVTVEGGVSSSVMGDEGRIRPYQTRVRLKLSD